MGGPLWSPASCSLCSPVEEHDYTPTTGRSFSPPAALLIALSVSHVHEVSCNFLKTTPPPVTFAVTILGRSDGTMVVLKLFLLAV
jgi:hypothetical protein